MEERKLKHLTQLIKEGKVTKAVCDTLVEPAEIKSVENDSYINFDGVKEKHPREFRNTCFGCSIALLNYEETLKINKI